MAPGQHTGIATMGCRPGARLSALPVLQCHAHAQMLCWCQVRHSRIRFPSTLNSAPREVVGRQPGPGCGTACLEREDESQHCESKRVRFHRDLGISVMPSSAATHLDKRSQAGRLEDLITNRIHDPTCVQ